MLSEAEKSNNKRYIRGRLPCRACGKMSWPTLRVGCGLFRFTCREGHQDCADWPYGWADDKPEDLTAWKLYLAEGELRVKFGYIPKAWDSCDGEPQKRYGLWRFVCYQKG